MDAVDDRRIKRHDVPIGEGEHRVEVHRRTQLGHAADDDSLGGVVFEQRRRDLGDGLTRRALAHAHQHRAVADRHDVAALERRLRPVLLGIAHHTVAPTKSDETGRSPCRAASRRGEPASTTG